MSLKDIKKIISENLKRYREANGLQKKEVAAFLGVGASSVTHWEDGSNSIDINRLAKLCELFGCDLSDMVSERKHPAVTDEEMRLVQAYRDNPILQDAVCRVLNIPPVKAAKSPTIAEDAASEIETTSADVLNATTKAK